MDRGEKASVLASLSVVSERWSDAELEHWPADTDAA